MLRRSVVSAVLVSLALAPVLLARGEEKESARLMAVAAMDAHDLAEANEIDHARKTVEREFAALDAGKLPTLPRLRPRAGRRHLDVRGRDPHPRLDRLARRPSRTEARFREARMYDGAP